MSRLVFAVLMIVPMLGCGGGKKPVAKSPKPTVTKKAKKPAAKQPAEVIDASPNLGVSNNLAQECTLADIGKTPKFKYDEFVLLAEDRAVLDVIATCVVSGPLKGRSLQLVGRADSRGTQEYNLALGTRRADTVAEYLGRIGVSTQQISITTRGDLDASGRDESGWRTDRRVDVQLMEDLKVTSSVP
jgi:peptidoglycan-associated lipoprotein